MHCRPHLELAALLVVVPLWAGCLPGDTRPEPGSVEVATRAGFGDEVITSDGWVVSFQRLLVALGSIHLEGSECNSYGEARYTRVYDFAADAEAPQKLALVYGLGRCTLEFQLRPPRASSLLGPGVTAGDLEFMRVKLADPWTKDPEQVSAFVSGRASRGGVTKHFEWTFRKGWSMNDCGADDEAETGGQLVLEGGDRLEATVVVDAGELLRERAADDAALVFEPLAAADADGDGDITLIELSAVPVAKDAFGEGASEAALANATRADLVYERLVPRMTRLADGGACKADVNDHHH